MLTNLHPDPISRVTPRIQTIIRPRQLHPPRTPLNYPVLRRSTITVVDLDGRAIVPQVAGEIETLGAVAVGAEADGIAGGWGGDGGAGG